ncbi:MAG: hypothetical protein AAF664_24795 [Planctomycetota bacterium]
MHPSGEVGHFRVDNLSSPPIMKFRFDKWCGVVLLHVFVGYRIDLGAVAGDVVWSLARQWRPNNDAGVRCRTIARRFSVFSDHVGALPTSLTQRRFEFSAFFGPDGPRIDLSATLSQ